MIKLRLHGELKELQKTIEQLAKNFKILQESEPYKDNGKSIYHRVYLDIEEKEGA